MKRNSKRKLEVSCVEQGDHHGCGGSRILLETNEEWTHTYTKEKKEKQKNEWNSKSARNYSPVANQNGGQRKILMEGVQMTWTYRLSSLHPVSYPLNLLQCFVQSLEFFRQTQGTKEIIKNQKFHKMGLTQITWRTFKRFDDSYLFHTKNCNTFLSDVNILC